MPFLQLTHYVIVYEKTRHMGFFVRVLWCMVDKMYHRANPRLSFRPTVCFVVEIQHFVCNRATTPVIEKLRSKGIATIDCASVQTCACVWVMHMYACYAYAWVIWILPCQTQTYNNVGVFSRAQSYSRLLLRYWMESYVAKGWHGIDIPTNCL